MQMNSLQTKLINSVRTHLEELKEITQSPDYANESPTLRLAIKIYVSTVGLSVDTWIKCIERENSQNSGT